MSQVDCTKCKGKGTVKCPCGGTAFAKSIKEGTNEFFGLKEDEKCINCNDTFVKTCNKCWGTGTIDEEDDDTSIKGDCDDIEEEDDDDDYEYDSSSYSSDSSSALGTSSTNSTSGYLWIGGLVAALIVVSLLNKFKDNNSISSTNQEFGSNSNSLNNTNNLPESSVPYKSDEPLNSQIETDTSSKDSDSLLAEEKNNLESPNNFNSNYVLAVQLYNELYAADNLTYRPENAELLKNRLTNVLEKAISLDQGVSAKILMVRHLYNYAFDYNDEKNKIQGVSPEDIRARYDLEILFSNKLEECISYSESILDYFNTKPSLNPVEKSNYKVILEILSKIYDAKGENEKALEYDKKKNEIE